MFRKFYRISENLIGNLVGRKARDLHELYNTLDWIDVGLVIAIVLRFSVLSGFHTPDLGPLNVLLSANPLVDVLLGVVSILICWTAFVVSGMLRKLGEISKLRYFVRLFWWPIWIPVDMLFIGLAIASISS